MATPKCPALVNFLILAIALLLIVYFGMIYLGKDAKIVPLSVSSSSEGFADALVASVAKGAGNPCQQNADCVSNFCAVVDSTKKTCY